MANIWWWWWRWGRVRVPGKTMLPSLLLKEREREADDSVRWVGGGKKRRKVFLLLRLLLSHLSLFLPSFSPPSTTSIWKQQRGSNTGRPRKKVSYGEKKKKKKPQSHVPKSQCVAFPHLSSFPPPGISLQSTVPLECSLSLSRPAIQGSSSLSFLPSTSQERRGEGSKEGRRMDEGEGREKAFPPFLLLLLSASSSSITQEVEGGEGESSERLRTTFAA